MDYCDIEWFALETNREGFCLLCRGTFYSCPLWESLHQPHSEDPVCCPGCLTADKRLNLLSKSGYQFVALSYRKYELLVQKLLWISKWLLENIKRVAGSFSECSPVYLHMCYNHGLSLLFRIFFRKFGDHRRDMLQRGEFTTTTSICGCSHSP